MTTTTGGDRTKAGGTEPARVRRATGDDIAALVRLRARMLADMGVDVGDEEAVWRSHAADWFAARMDRDDAFAAFVVDDPELGVVACAVGACDAHAPSPNSPSGLRGHVSNVCTDPRRRRRGHARACMDALLAWFRDETPVSVVGLNATDEAAALYASYGFAPPRHSYVQFTPVRQGAARPVG